MKEYVLVQAGVEVSKVTELGSLSRTMGFSKTGMDKRLVYGRFIKVTPLPIPDAASQHHLFQNTDIRCIQR